MGQPLAKTLIANRWWLLVIAAIFWGIAFFPARQLEMDRRIEQMFPEGDPSVESYQLLRNRFGGNAVAMLVYRDPQLLTPAGLDQVSQIAERAGKVPGVLGVLTLAQVNDALGRTRPGKVFFTSNTPAILENDRMAVGFRKLFEGYTHDASGQYAAVVAMLDPAGTSIHDQTIAQLRIIGDSIDSSQPAALVGEPVLVAEGFALVEEDGRRLSTTTIYLLGLITLIIFRSPRWVLIELVIIFWAVTTTRAAAVKLGLQLSMVSSMLTAIVTVIAVASVIHIAVAHGVRRRRGDTPRQAAERSLAKILPPIIWACITDAAGFAALMISSVGPVRDFGLMMTLGTGMVLAAILLILPAMILFPPQKFISYSIPGDRLIRRWLVQLVLATKDYRTALACATAALIVITGFGLNKLETETNFIKNFRSGSELARGYDMVETEFGGAGVWDVILPMPQSISRDYLASVRQLEKQLREISIDTTNHSAGESISEQAQLTKVLSMADADAVAGSEGLLRLAPPTVRITGMRVAMPTFVDALITPVSDSESEKNGQESSASSDQEGLQQQSSPRYLRIMLRSAERLPAESKLALINEVEAAVIAHTTSPSWQSLFDNDNPVGSPNNPQVNPQVKLSTDSRAPYQGHVTGYYVLLARLIDSLLRDQWLCLSAAAIVIFFVMWLAFRSFKLAAICMVPNLLPVLFVLGVIGLLGIQINMGAAMIAAVSIGLTIDGSIHFLAGYVASRKRGDSRVKAVLHSQRRVGLPVLLATFALALGFSVLTSSAFVPTITFGFLVSAALAAGTLANLTLLPLILASRKA